MSWDCRETDRLHSLAYYERLGCRDRVVEVVAGLGCNDRRGARSYKFEDVVGDRCHCRVTTAVGDRNEVSRGGHTHCDRTDWSECLGRNGREV